MAYCPKCKSEYEEDIKMCSDCNIDLVADLETHSYMKPLIKVKKAELDEMVKYLDYSGISKVETQPSEEGVLISVSDEEFETAMTYLKVYVHEHMEETNEEDYYFDEYVTEEVDTTATVTDMKSTIYTFGFIGAGSLTLGILNYLDIVSFSGFNKLMFSSVLAILGVAFIMIAISTANKISGATSESEEKERQIDAIFDWYKDEKNFEGFYKRHKIKKDEADEGALYFYIFDILKKEVSKQYPDVGESYINAAIEKIYEELT